MKKAILSAFGAFISILSAIIFLTAFAQFEDALFAIIAVFFGFIALSLIGWGIEDTKMGDIIENLFTDEGGEE